MFYIPFPLKRCSKCGEYYPANKVSFRVTPKGLNGLMSVCRQCECKYSRQRYSANPEHAREVTRRYRNANLERAREATRNWRKNHREYEREYQRNRRLTEPDKTRTIAQRHRTKSGALMNERNRQWRKSHPERSRYDQALRRSRTRALPCTFTEQDWNRALDYWHGVCAYCGNPPRLFDRNTVLHQEHHIPARPAYKLNEPNPGYVATNIIPACQSCNFSKGNRNPEQWTVEHFGKRNGNSVLKRIQNYFEWTRRQAT